jgi:hypothetical protein
MSTQPRMSAPIGRLKIRTSEPRKRRATGAGAWQAAAPPGEAEMSEAEDALVESTHPSFYPFPLGVRNDDEG